MKNIQQIVSAYDTPLTPTMTVRRVFPGHALKNIDPFVFLDHFGPGFHDLATSPFARGTGAHPHRGFCTFSYLLDGEMEHRDSRGHHGIIGAGGAQWMKAGSGIVHDEKPPRPFLEKGGNLHGFQLWINLPKSHKEDVPAYESLPANEVAEWTADGGTVRVLIGAIEGAASPVTAHSPMLVAHVRIHAGGSIEVPVPEGWGASVYLAGGTATVGNAGQTLGDGELAVFAQQGQGIAVANPTDMDIDLLLMAGQPIGEPIYTSGPFVMADIPGIQRAYDDFNAGRYGEI